jgi:MoaA/NifB/PqqE/SkfB family radical SAM enzyme
MKEVGRPWKTMSFELFKSIADGMLEFQDKVKVLRLYKDGEPLLNKRLVDMVKYAKDIGASERIDTTTNASLLTPEKGKALADAGLDRINISIEGVNNEQYKSFSDVRLEFDRIVENVRSFYEVRGGCEMLVKINGDTLTNDDKNKFMEVFGDITDKIYIEHIMSCWPNFDMAEVESNQDYGIYGQEISEVNACAYPFYSFAVNSDGLVSLCFLDWSRKLVLGDLKSENIVDIWTGRRMKNFQRMFLKGMRKSHPICGNCGQMTHGMPDNIDPYRESILESLEAQGYFDDIDVTNHSKVFFKS